MPSEGTHKAHSDAPARPPFARQNVISVGRRTSIFTCRVRSLHISDGQSQTERGWRASGMRSSRNTRRLVLTSERLLGYPNKFAARRLGKVIAVIRWRWFAGDTRVLRRGDQRDRGQNSRAARRLGRSHAVEQYYINRQAAFNRARTRIATCTSAYASTGWAPR